MSFNDDFQRLTGNPPFPWQEALYRDWFSVGKFPGTCSLPPGLGKTSVVAVWLIALAHHPGRVPRRLVYVVNRRTVVDQTTNEVERYRSALQSETLKATRERLTELCALAPDTKPETIASPLALSTLRGQFADNREWSSDPARPAVIVGTVDMIGSRLLFSGYGVGFKSKPLHAGFLGQDALLVHDEAHLEPAFQALLAAIEREQRRCNEFGAFRVIELSATSRELNHSFELTARERDCPDVIPNPPTEPIHVVWRRQKASKVLRFVPITEEKKCAEKIAEIALQRARGEAGSDSNAAVLVFVRKLDDVKQVCALLTDRKSGIGETQVRQLTGTMRGLERDRFAKHDPVFMRFLPEKSRNPDVVPTPGTVYLVCTSAGEVGVDISADHLICDLSSFDSMAQRFGRVNRYGQHPSSRIDVVQPEEIGKRDKKTGELRADALDISRRKTLLLLKTLPAVGKQYFDASPSALSSLPATARQEAFTPPPTILPTSDILFDAWAMTSIRGNMPGRPEVAPYLHGSAEDLPQTTIAWRSELDLVARNPDPSRALQAIFAKHPIRPHETVTVNSFRVIEFLQEITRKREDLRGTRIAILLARRMALTSIGELIDKPGPLNADPTLILPASFGCVNDKGMLDADAIPNELNSDVSDQPCDIADRSGYEPLTSLGTRARVIIKRTDDGWTSEPLVSGTTVETLPNRALRTSTELVNALRGGCYRVRLVQPIEWDTDDEDQVVKSLVLLSPLRQRQPQEEQPLEDHVNRVCDWAKVLAEKLRLGEPLRDALVFAAKWHDEGKKARLWQRYIGNPSYQAPLLGKSSKWCDPKRLSGYRHEFGSLLRIENPQPHQTACVLPVDPDTRDLALHLVAAHHGHARPHFDHSVDRDFSSKECETTHIEAIRRFARLQRKYGRWGLAYLESLLRAADAAASAGLETDDEMDNASGD